MNKQTYVVTTGCNARIIMAVVSSEKEAYILANAMDGLVYDAPSFSTSREARQMDSNIAYEVQRTRGAE